MPPSPQGRIIVYSSARMDRSGPWARMIVGNWEMVASSNADLSVGGNLTGMPPTVRATEMTVRSTGRPLPPTATERQTVAYSFDGVDDYLSMTIGTYDQVTFSAWVKIASFDNEYPKLFDLGSSYPLFRIGFNGNRPDHVSSGIVGNMGSLSSTFSGAHSSNLSYGIQSVGSWIHVVTSLGVDSFHSTFLDGILIDQSSYKNTPSSDGALKIAVNASIHSDHFFNGSIDDIRIYDRALSESEVSALYTLESSPPSYEPVKIVDENVTAIASGSETSYFIKNDGSLWGMGRNDRGQLGNAQGLDQGLVGWWKFDGDATDSSGNGNDGTVNGATLTNRSSRTGKWKRTSFDGVDDYIEMGNSQFGLERINFITHN